MARIIPLFPKKTKISQPAQTSRFLPADLEKLRKKIASDVLESFKSIVRKVIMFPYKQWMTSEQAQEKLNISAKDLRKLSDSGKIDFQELCGDYYYEEKDVARALRRQKRSKTG
jgi:hypothetical protein